MVGVEKAIRDNVRARIELQVHILSHCGLDTLKPIRTGKTKITDQCLNVSVRAALGLSLIKQSTEISSLLTPIHAETTENEAAVHEHQRLVRDFPRRKNTPFQF